MEPLRLAILIPAHNEATNIGPLSAALLVRYAAELAQVIIVDDVSTDGTDRVADNLARQEPRITVVHRTPPPGVGRALAAGVAAMRPEITHLLSIDADFLENIEEINGVLQPVREGWDGSVGSRFLKPDSLVNYPQGKLFFNRAFHLLAKLVLGPDRHDLTNNFKCYRAAIWRELRLHEGHFAANAETGLYPALRGYRIREMPVRWVQRQAGQGFSKYKLFKVGPAYARVLGRALLYRCRLISDL